MGIDYEEYFGTYDGDEMLKELDKEANKEFDPEENLKSTVKFMANGFDSLFNELKEDPLADESDLYKFAMLNSEIKSLMGLANALETRLKRLYRVVDTLEKDYFSNLYRLEKYEEEEEKRELEKIIF